MSAQRPLQITIDNAEWIRDYDNTVFEERPARPEDLIAGVNDTVDGVDFTQATSGYFEDPSDWKNTYPTYQSVLDKYIMRRFVIRIALHKNCNSSGAIRSGISAIMNGSSLTYKLSGIEQSLDYSISTGINKYLVESIQVQDTGKTMSTITMQIRGYGPWTVVKLLATT